MNGIDGSGEQASHYTARSFLWGNINTYRQDVGI